MADHAKAETGNDINAKDQQGGNRIALHELAGAVHRAVKIGLGRNFAAPGFRFFCRHQARGKIGIDRHLLARQGIQRKPGGNFRNAARALGHDHQIDDHQDHENEQADNEIAADQERAERFDHMARRSPAFVAIDQHDAGGGNVQRQPQQRGKQQNRWK